MRLKPLLTCAAIYMAVIGLGMMLVPRQLGIGAVPADAARPVAQVFLVVHRLSAACFVPAARPAPQRETTT
jgi:hypothetical protein